MGVHEGHVYWRLRFRVFRCRVCVSLYVPILGVHLYATSFLGHSGLSTRLLAVLHASIIVLKISCAFLHACVRICIPMHAGFSAQ